MVAMFPPTGCTCASGPGADPRAQASRFVVWWRWRESNPRLPGCRWGFSERIREKISDLRHSPAVNGDPSLSEVSHRALRRFPVVSRS